MSLRTVFESQPERRYIMFGGKGGLGKTTLSATCAFWLASQGKRVLLFSVDPQASLSDIFQQDIFGKGPVPIMPNLWAQEVDADRRIKDYQEEIRKKILDMYGFERVPEEIDNYISAASAEPAMEESAIFDAVVDIIVQGDYDYYIYDLVPEEMIILDTRKAAELFAKFDVPISGYVVNRVLPPDLGAGKVPDYLRNRITMQHKYMKDIQGIFGREILAHVPEMERDITGLAMIERLAKRLFEEAST